MQLNVTIDGRALVGHRTGIGVHTAEIARRLRLDPRPLIATHTNIENREGLEDLRFRVDRMPLGVAWQQLVLPRVADSGVLWAPHGTLPLAITVPAVATIHDFTAITRPQAHRLKTILSFNLFIGRSLDRARRIAAVSRAVADEAIRGLGVEARKVEIVPNGVDDFFTPGDGEEGHYILFVGTREPRKGLPDLIDAWRALPPPRPRLILAGDAGWRTKIPEGIEVIGFVDRVRLRELYRGARAFVYPSHEEGFGIPPLEALACGAPVIATRVGAIPEFAAGAASLVDPGDRAALRDALGRVLGDPVLRGELRARGPERASLYRWDRSARVMEELLAEAAACG